VKGNAEGVHDTGSRLLWQPPRIDRMIHEQTTAAAAAAAAKTAVAREQRQKRAASQRAAPSVGAPPRRRAAGSACGRKLVMSARATLRSAPYFERGDVVSLGSYGAACEPRMYVIAHALREPALVALLPPRRCGVTSDIEAEIERVYRAIPHSARFQPKRTWSGKKLRPSTIWGWGDEALDVAVGALRAVREQPASRTVYDESKKRIIKALSGYGKYQSNHILRSVLLAEKRPVPGDDFLDMGAVVVLRKELGGLKRANAIAASLGLPPFSCVGELSYAVCMS
jgi:hypothetical protein